MIVTVWSIATLLAMTTFASDVPVLEDNNYDYETPLYEIQDILPYIINKEVSGLLIAAAEAYNCPARNIS